MLLWNSMQQNFFELFLRCVAWRKPVLWALQAVLLTSGLGFCSDMHYQLLDLFWEVCACPNHTHSKNLPQFNLHSKCSNNLQVDTSAPELNFKCPTKGYDTYAWNHWSFLFLIICKDVTNLFCALSLWCMECRLMWKKSNLMQFNIGCNITKREKKIKGYEYFRKALYLK